MSRSGYTDDWEGDVPLEFYRQAVQRATTGYRGQHLLMRLRDALDAMPVKRLIAGDIKDGQGDVCALGALDPAAPAYSDNDDGWFHSQELADHFNVAHALAAEIVYMNDEYFSWRSKDETPEARWVRMRAWVESQIVGWPHARNHDARRPVQD